MSELSQEIINKEISKIVEGLEMDKAIEAKLMAEIQELVNKVQFPDNYCPKCADRMFFKGGSFVCPLHGPQGVILTKISTPSPQEEPEFKPRPIRNPKRAATIRELANGLAPSGSPSATPVDPKDGSPLPGATSKEINWV